MAKPPRMWNPLGEMHASCRGALERREAALERYSFAIPNERAVDAIAACSPSGVVEIGAGLGYWASVLHNSGVDVAAYDIAPPPSRNNRWYAGSEPWHQVEFGDPSVVRRHSDRTLLLVWPTRNETWPLMRWPSTTGPLGSTVAVVSEPPGGRTGDDVFHAMLGHIPQCLACRYRSSGSACTCAVPVLWSLVKTVDLPQWSGVHDALGIYTRVADPHPKGGRLRRRFTWPARATGAPVTVASRSTIHEDRT